MKIFYRKNSSVFQVVTELGNTDKYTAIEVYFSDVNPIDSPQPVSELLFSGVPQDVYLIPYRLGLASVGSIYLVGVSPSGKEIAGVCPIRNNVQFSDPFFADITRGHITRKSWYQKLRAEPAFVYFSNRGTPCRCVNSAVNQANPNCPLCRGFGKIESYTGSQFDIMVMEEFSRVIDSGLKGRLVSQSLPAFIFGFPYVYDGVLVERQNGDLLSIERIEYKYSGGTLIEQSFNMVLVPEAWRFNLNRVQV